MFLKSIFKDPFSFIYVDLVNDEIYFKFDKIKIKFWKNGYLG